ncbi:hypothetical protein ACWD4G_13930 [Streptomyces sp. NPDC002643]
MLPAEAADGVVPDVHRVGGAGDALREWSGSRVTGIHHPSPRLDG